MIDFKRFFKAIGIINDQDQTKSLEITVANSTSPNTKVTLISNATQDRTIYLPDIDGTLATGVTILTPDRAVITDNGGEVVASTVTSTEIDALSDISGNIQDQLDSITSDVSGLVVDTLVGDESDKAPSVRSVNEALSNIDLVDYLKKDGTIPLNNNAFLKGMETDGLTERNLIGVHSSNQIRVGTPASPLSVRGNTLLIQSDNISLTKNSPNSGTAELSSVITTVRGWSGDGLSGNVDIRGNLGIKLTTGTVKQIDATSSLIKNVLNPVDPQDAATKDYVDSVAGGGGGSTIMCRHSRTGTAQLAAFGTTDVVYNQTDYDDDNIYSAGVFTPPEDGVYRVTAQVSVNIVTDTKHINSVGLHVDDGRGVVSKTEIPCINLNSTSITYSITDSVALTTSDELKVVFQNGSGSDMYVQIANTFLTIEKI